MMLTNPAVYGVSPMCIGGGVSERIGIIWLVPVLDVFVVILCVRSYYVDSHDALTFH